MIINFKDLKKGRILEFEKIYLQNEIDVPENEINIKNKKIKVNVKLEKRSNFILLILNISFVLKLICSRCLENFEKKYDLKEEFYLKKGEEILPKEKSLSNEDVYTIYYQEEIIDITPLVRDTIILAKPLKPLCRKNCKGLCPICGVNWNYQKCEHFGKKMETSFGLKLKEALKNYNKLRR